MQIAGITLEPKARRAGRIERSPRLLAASPVSGVVHAVAVERVGAGLRVVRAATVPVEAFGDAQSAARALDAAGFPAADCVLALPREQAIVALAELPTDDEAELRSMARMAITRDASPEGVETASDFQIASRGQGRAAVVLAGAPRPRLAAAIESAGRTSVRASVRTLGMLAFLRGAPAYSSGVVLAIDIAPGVIECALVRDGMLVHARGVTLPADATAAATAAVEAKRAMAALRASDATLAFDRVALACTASIAEELSRALAASAGCPVERIEAHPQVSFADPAVREDALSCAIPLLGLLLEDDAALRGAGQAIDLLHPTPEIDVAARNRQRVLMVAGALVVAMLAGWTFGARSFRNLEERRDSLEEKARGALPELRRFKRDELKLAHIDAYLGLAPQWLGHLESMRRYLPDQSTVVLDGMTAQLVAADIEYSKDGKFVGRPELRLVLDGEALDRATADALRDSFVREKTYTLSSTGADGRGGRRLAAPFAYTLRTAEVGPRATDGAAPAPAKERSP
ncbi:MAG: hypothetical protein ACKO0W_05475 [Planctomycetota bacterium]